MKQIACVHVQLAPVHVHACHAHVLALVEGLVENKVDHVICVRCTDFCIRQEFLKAATLIEEKASLLEWHFSFVSNEAVKE